MHPRVMSERMSVAQTRLAASANAIAGASGVSLNPQLVTALTSGARDQQTLLLTRLEAVADLLESVAVTLGVDRDNLPPRWSLEQTHEAVMRLKSETETGTSLSQAAEDTPVIVTEAAVVSDQAGVQGASLKRSRVRSR